jgi:predicted ribosome quality control (RQC) complex YloA/Tae2 family protein
MPFDGVVVKSIIEELNEIIPGSRIEKIFQPENDEIVLLLRNKGKTARLVMSANANCPRLHLSDVSKGNPKNPPVFCMLLRKHISGGRLTEISFHDFERIIVINIETTNELGDISFKKLIIEIMGRHSNIILLNEINIIIDSIKHVNSEISSKREVVPAIPYAYPPSQDKTSPLKLQIDGLLKKLSNETKTPSVNTNISKFLLNNIKGFSPLLCYEICYRAGIDERITISALTPDMLDRLNSVIALVISDIASKNYHPCIIYRDSNMQKPFDFHCMDITCYPVTKTLSSINLAVDTYYKSKDTSERVSQKKSGLLKLLNTNIERCTRKLSLQQQELDKSSQSSTFRLYGELITANIHSIPKGSSKAILTNYHTNDNTNITIPLNKNFSVEKNAQIYFNKYKKAKRTYENTLKQIKKTREEYSYLESLYSLLENSLSIDEVNDIKEELIQQGYIKNKKVTVTKNNVNKPNLHCYKSSDGIYVYAGRNNLQNDYLTLKMSSSKDLWLHTRNIPGTHVVIKKTVKNIPDSTVEEAAIIAAFHSKSKYSSNVPVDYTEIKNVKKPHGAKPGMVIYDNFKTVFVTPDEQKIRKLLK